MRVYRCSHLLTPTGFVDGAVAVRGGVVVAAGPLKDIPHETENELHEFGRAIVMPGLVNAHTHLELSWMGEDRPPGGDYLSWLRALLERRDREDAATTRRAAERACAALVARGTVAVGDICNGDWVADVWAGQAVLGVLFHEVLGLDRPAERHAEARHRIDSRPAPEGWRWSLVPHAPHTTSPELMRLLADDARQSGAPCSIHVAETAGERELLTAAAGPFRDFFIERGFLDAGAEPPGQSPVETVSAAGLLDSRTLIVHAVDLDAAEIQRLGRASARIVTCPRSNAYLGTGTAPVPELLAAGCTLALGTDSLATTGDLDLFAEMAALRRAHPSLAPRDIVHAATAGGAEALGLAEELGSIEPGKRALLTVVPFDDASGGTEDPYGYLCDNPAHAFPLADVEGG